MPNNKKKKGGGNKGKAAAARSNAANKDDLAGIDDLLRCVVSHDEPTLVFPAYPPVQI